MTITDVKDYLPGCPRADTVPRADDLAGWAIPDGNTVCNRCASRLCGRGILLPRTWNAIWRDKVPVVHCDACGRTH